MTNNITKLKLMAVLMITLMALSIHASAAVGDISLNCISSPKIVVEASCDGKAVSGIPVSIFVYNCGKWNPVRKGSGTTDNAGEFNSPALGYRTYKVIIQLPDGSTYEKVIKFDKWHNSEVTVEVSACTPPADIPEFPTIALPVAAILGLAFVFGRKKE